MKLEKMLIHWLIKIKDELFLACVCVLGLLVRLVGYQYVSSDMSWFLWGWFQYIAENGHVKSLSEQVGNYNVLYQTLISFMSYSSIDSMYLYKSLSVFFDFALAFLVALFFVTVLGKKRFGKEFSFVCAAVLFLPTVIMDSAFWGQCDSIYTFFVIATLFAMYKQRYKTAFVMLGIAFAFKLQTIFVVPFILLYYVYLMQKEANGNSLDDVNGNDGVHPRCFSIFYFLISIVVFWASGIVAYINGRELLAPFKAYFAQTEVYDNMWLNVPSFYMLMGDDYAALKKFAVLITVFLCGVMMYAVLCGYKNLDSFEAYINTAGWFVWTCVLFLPAMHERYTYILDILLVLLAFVNRRYLKYLCVSVAISTMTYGNFLFFTGETTLWYGIVYLVLYICFTVEIVRNDCRCKDHQNS